MSDRDALMAAVLAAPDDDLPRLVFADWLEENGEPERAEFIRLQCELAKPGWNSRQLIRENQLLNATVPGTRERYRWEWTRPVREAMPAHWAVSVEFDATAFRRGFVAAVVCAAADWIAHGDKVRAVCPIQLVRLTDWPEMETWQTTYGDSYGWALAGDSDPDWCLPFVEFNDLLTPDKSIPQVVCEARWKGLLFELPPAPAPE